MNSKQPVTANQITAALLIELPKRLPGMFWRNNSGKGFGWGPVMAVIPILMRGDVQGAIRHIRSLRPIIFGMEGSPDVIGMVGPTGRFVGIEIKAGKDRQSPGQKAFQRRVEKLGGLYLIAHEAEGPLALLEGTEEMTCTEFLADLAEDLRRRENALREMEVEAQELSIARLRFQHKADGIHIAIKLIEDRLRDMRKCES